MSDFDDRLTENILFAQDEPSTIRDRDCRKVRSILIASGAGTARDVIGLGCTGLAFARADSMPLEKVIAELIFARSHMAGAGFGIPCYVPPTQFCLIHNTIGGLQPNQVPRHPEGLNFCSRALTREEQRHAAGMQALINEEGADKVKKLFGAEKVDPAIPDVQEVAPEVPTVAPAVPTIAPAISTPMAVMHARFFCPEHATLVWACRYCLAVAVVNGPLQPDVFVECRRRDKSIDSTEIENLGAVLGDEGSIEVTAFVRVKCWKRQMVETDE
jgi:hypothetical protein